MSFGGFDLFELLRSSTNVVFDHVEDEPADSFTALCSRR